MIDDDRGQMTGTPIPIVGVVLAVGTAVLLAEIGVGILPIIVIGILVIAFIRVSAVIGPASK